MQRVLAVVVRSYSRAGPGRCPGHVTRRCLLGRWWLADKLQRLRGTGSVLHLPRMTCSVRRVSVCHCGELWAEDASPGPSLALCDPMRVPRLPGWQILHLENKGLGPGIPQGLLALASHGSESHPPLVGPLSPCWRASVLRVEPPQGGPHCALRAPTAAQVFRSACCHFSVAALDARPLPPTCSLPGLDLRPLFLS